jgi:hypothetical protein
MLLNAVSRPVELLLWTADYTSAAGPVRHIARRMPVGAGRTMREMAGNSSGDRKMGGRWTDTRSTGERPDEVSGSKNPDRELGTWNPERELVRF